MLLQKDLIEIGITLANYLRDNENIQDFCQEQFETKPTIFVGELLRKAIPTLADTPYIVINQMKKTEGTGNYVTYQCQFVIGVGVEPNSKVEAGKGIFIYDGYDVLCKFATLIQRELNKRKDGSRLISKCEYEPLGAIEPNGTHWAGIMSCTWNITQVINTAYEEQF